jgi:hypothetical protein
MIFGSDRNRLRQYYLDAWQKRRTGEALEPLEALIAAVVEQHPEYHALLESAHGLERDYTPEMGQTNPFLHMGMHISLAEQIGSDRPAGIRAVHRRLSASCGSPHEAEHRMMDCLGLVLWEAQRQNQPPDEQTYLECLKKLL